MINDLIKLGFRQIGTWELSESYASGVNMNLYQLNDQRVIYCFVVDSVIKYIGICDEDERTLEMRMKRYRSRAPHQKNKTGTSLEIILKIKKCLEERNKVEIYALKPPNNNYYQGLEVDLVRGLEYPLIKKFRPPWNKRGK